MKPKLKDPAFVAKMAKFVKASEKGWDWAEEERQGSGQDHPRHRHHRRADREHQKQMMGEIAKLLAANNGELDPKDYDRTVSELISGGSDPVITKKPEGAWTHAVYEAMK